MAFAFAGIHVGHAQTPAAPQAPAGRGAGRGGPPDTLVSPEVNADRTVTFRVRAPQASTVTLTGDWLATPASPTGGVLPMTKGADGVWSVTSEPLEELWVGGEPRGQDFDCDPAVQAAIVGFVNFAHAPGT